MPRKTRPDPAGSAWVAHRFNEAAARCRGKRLLTQALQGEDGGASMRPRPDAAENTVAAATMANVMLHASMRPRPDAAENAPLPQPAGRGRPRLQ